MCICCYPIASLQNCVWIPHFINFKQVLETDLAMHLKEGFKYTNTQFHASNCNSWRYLGKSKIWLNKWNIYATILKILLQPSHQKYFTVIFHQRRIGHKKLSKALTIMLKKNYPYKNWNGSILVVYGDLLKFYISHFVLWQYCSSHLPSKVVSTIWLDSRCLSF